MSKHEFIIIIGIIKTKTVNGFIMFDVCHPKHGQEKIQMDAGLLSCSAPRLPVTFERG